MYKFLIFSVVFLAFSSCNKEKLKSPDAAFLVVDNVNVFTTSTQGSNSHKITDIWYYVNDNFKGVFPIGSPMPVLGSGNSKITFFAGIKNNGISTTRLPYEFYQAHVFNQNFETGKTYTVSPTFQYISSAVFPTEVIDNFDSGTGTGTKFVSVGDNPFYIISDVNQVFGGVGKSLYFTMTDAKPTTKIKTTTPLNLPVGGATVYLELNYKCNQSFDIGVIAGGVDERLSLTINPSTTWNKIYVQLTAAVSTQPTYLFYEIYMKATKQTESPEILLDNVKLVTR